MSDWQPGDLALCVQGGVRDPTAAKPEGWPVAGKIYTVSHAALYQFKRGLFLGLFLVDGPKNASGKSIWNAGRFRKITPGADIEGIEEPRRIPVKEKADA